MEPLFCLKRIGSILDVSRTWDEPGRLAAYASVRQLLRDLEYYASSLPMHDQGYCEEKIASLIGHLDQLFGFATDDGHGSEQHLVWAVGCLQGIAFGFTGNPSLS